MSTENLSNKNAAEKIKAIVNSVDFAMMETNLGGRPSHIIPMSTKKVDDKGRIWFISNANSQHNKNIETNKESQLIYSNPSSMEFMTLYGKSWIMRDSKIIDEIYSKPDDAWFEGKNDPLVTAICFEPLDGQYWDTKHGALVSLFKVGVGLITGKEQDLGTTGSLKV